jgi:ribosomal protein S24E
MKIISKEKSGLIDRTELKAEFPHIGKPTPKTSEIKKAVAAELKADENLVIIKEIYTKYGEGTSKIKAFAYNNLEELKKLEKYVEPKKEEPKAEEKPAEQPKVEEAPKEEVKEEPKENGKESKTEEQANK